MQRYLVGGAVRDALLGLPVADRDWVVVGARPEDLEAQGYRPVGRDFPVYLHPETGEEHALARTERKTGRGYHGFAFDTSPEVTIEEDLARRDLTINAMARDTDGAIVDPYGGARDLEARILRHVSTAFVEDPVRVLRVARFAARFAPLGFRVARETRGLMRRMVAGGEVDALVPERVWLDTCKALGEERPSAFVQTLRDCGALARLFPEVDRLFGVPQPVRHHPEIDTGLHTLLVVDQAAALSERRPRVVFAALLHDLGKGSTPRAQWPRHPGHELAGLPAIDAVCARLKVPRDFARLAHRVGALHLRAHQALELRPGKVLALLEEADGLRQPDAFGELLLACEADARGRLGRDREAYPQRPFLARAREAAAGVDSAPLRARGLAGPALGEALRAARADAIGGLARA